MIFGHGDEPVFSKRHKMVNPGSLSTVSAWKLFTYWWGVQICPSTEELPSWQRESDCLLWLAEGRRFCTREMTKTPVLHSCNVEFLLYNMTWNVCGGQFRKRQTHTLYSTPPYEMVIKSMNTIRWATVNPPLYSASALPQWHQLQTIFKQVVTLLP